MDGAITLDTRLSAAVGGRTAAPLQQAFGMETVRDLLWHFPRRYSNRGELTPLLGLPVGEHVTVLAQVLDVRLRTMQRRPGKLLEVRITDGVGTLQLTFFNQPWRATELQAGVRGIFSGKVTQYGQQLQLQHPDYRLFDEHGYAADIVVDAEEEDAPSRSSSSASTSSTSSSSVASSSSSQPAIAGGATAPGGAQGRGPGTTLSRQQAMKLDEAEALAWAERPVPIYSAASKLASWKIEAAVSMVLEMVDGTDAVKDPLPNEVRQAAGIFPLGVALKQIHQPERKSEWVAAQASMRFREAFDLQLGLLYRRQQLGFASSTRRPAISGGLLDTFDAGLPFDLTAGQREVGETFAWELSRPHPMHRLLQGEVGSGKTIVALRAMLQVAETGGQSAMLAPTEVLAGQHYRSVVEALGPVLAERVQPVLLTSKMPVAQRRKALLAIASGVARIVIGTHALISEHVTFFDLGLVVVDEQHRFGVDQREALRQKGKEPHVLAMTATPIPRTVALTVFGDLETSTMRDMPPGRQGVQTFAVAVHERPKWAERAWLRALEEVAKGRQVYVVCPAISGSKREEGDEAFMPDAEAVVAAAGAGAQSGRGAKPGQAGPAAAMGGEGLPPALASVEQTVAELSARADYAGIRVEALTGAMKSEEKDRVMRAFSAGEIDVLVATTVIEVGVNVPNASLMIVRDADRFGISQLHQLRGRVGRGEHPGLCLLLTGAEAGSVARERIEAVAATTDGFELAEVDLELRREGDILGTAQSGGRSTLQLLRVTQHGEIIAHARALAGELLLRDPELSSAPELAQALKRQAELNALENLAKS